jgi:steroid 5-alpha reductase family enzyme
MNTVLLRPDMPAMAVVAASPIPVLWFSAAAVAGLMLAVWIAGTIRHDISLVDLAWGPAFALVALVAALVAGRGDPARRWLLVALTALWGLRLALHLARRKRAEAGEDRRYRQMRARHPHRFALWSLGAVFVTQGVLVLLVSLPLQVGARRPGPLTPWVIAGLAVFALGLGFEALGDAQLARFTAQPANRGRVMDRGLWRYTRHPNYFGDACVWWGLWLIVLPAGGTWWTLVGPAAMTLLLVRGSGKRLLERDISQRRPEYADYVRRTSGFVPLPPRGRSR